MNESYDPANHLLVIAFIVFYWHLLRIWHQPPPSDDKKVGERKAPTIPEPALGAAPLRQTAAGPALPLRAAPAMPPQTGLAAVRALDGRFDETAFLAGAARAYELVLNAYAEEDSEVLENLLDAEAASDFTDALLARRRRGEKLRLTFIGIRSMELVQAWVEAGLEEISVRFTSELVTATYAADGKLLDGDPERIVQMADLWTFGRHLAAHDRNWKVVATQEG